MTVKPDVLFGTADGYDGDGYDAGGYGRDGFNKAGYDRSGANDDGYDEDGLPVSVDAGELDLRDLWESYKTANAVAGHRSSAKHGFLVYLRGIVREPDAITEVVFCVDCGDPVWQDETDAARGDSTDRICESCSDNWDSCCHCENRFPGDELTETLAEDRVCESCRVNSYSYCDECEGYYPDSRVDDHEHGDFSGDCCEAPARTFTLRNDGEAPLANDTRAVITLPSGVIPPEGIFQIARYLRQQQDGLGPFDRDKYYQLSYDLDVLGDKWQAKEGNFTKRLSRHAYKKYALKIEPEVLSQVGCIARDHSGKQTSAAVELTRELNLSAEAFGHGDSCWWGSTYGESRCALKSNGGLGMRSFSEDGYVTGRAWVMPLRLSAGPHLKPTFDTENPDAFMVFNGYGELSGYTAARILAHMAGWTYRKTGFRCSPMYVNAGGYLVAPEETAAPYTDGSLDLYLSAHANLHNVEQEEAEKARTEKETLNV